MLTEERRGELEEELALIRDAYITLLTGSMENAYEISADHWLELRAAGKFSTWKELEFEAPATSDFQVTEIPYGFQIQSKSTGGLCRVRVVTRDRDLFYDLDFSKNVARQFRDLVQEIFTNDRAVYYDPNSPCTRKAVTCIDEYKKGTSSTVLP